jgi:hypothetical protein
VRGYTADQFRIDRDVEAYFSARDAGEFARKLFALVIGEFECGEDFGALEPEMAVNDGIERIDDFAQGGPAPVIAQHEEEIRDELMERK